MLRTARYDDNSIEEQKIQPADGKTTGRGIEL